MPPSSPKKLVVNEALIKAFIDGALEPKVERKVAEYLEARPELFASVTSASGDGFLNRMREAKLRSAVPANDSVSITQSEPAQAEPRQVDRKSQASDVPALLANYSGYQIVKELGRGGMGVVYLAKNIQMDRLEVLKVLSQRLLDHEGAKERFLREVRAVSKLSHPNIVTSYSILPLDGLMVFAMEYAHGMDLHKFIHKHRPIPVGLACSLARQLALGLQHAHEKGLVHRDIKPSNAIVYKSDGQLQLKILDFGLAKATSEKKSDGLTQDGTMLGTPEYMSPEQTLNAAKADIRSDIYSLGCTLYHMLSGKPPFTGTHGEILMAHAQREVATINLLRTDVSTELGAVVAKMMAKEVLKRFQVPLEVAAALEPFVGKSRTSRSASDAVLPASNTVTDLAASDRDTSVDEQRPELSLDYAVESQQNLKVALSFIEILNQPKPTQLAPRKTVKRTQTKGSKWMGTSTAVVASLFFAGLLWLSGVFHFKTPEGTIVIEQMPADAEVFVDGKKFEVRWNQGNEIAEVSVAPGKRQVRVANGNKTLTGQTVTIHDNERHVLRIALEPNPTSDAAIVVKSENAKASLSVATTSINPKTTDSRKCWKHSNGQFRILQNGEWEEESGNGKIYRFREISRNTEFVELDALNGDTRIRVRIYDYRTDYGRKPGLTFTTMHTGSWLNESGFTDKTTKTPTMSEKTKHSNDSPIAENLSAGAEFSSLWNGKNLEGWTTPYGGISHSIADGVLSVDFGPVHYASICTERNYSNFHAVVDLRIPNGYEGSDVNKQIFVRTKQDADYIHGLQFSIGGRKNNGEEAKLGEFVMKLGGRPGGPDSMHFSFDNKGDQLDGVTVRGASLQSLVRDKWQVLEIIAIGGVVHFLANGELTMTVVDEQNRFAFGALAFRGNWNTRLEFRTIKIKELPNSVDNDFGKNYMQSIRELRRTDTQRETDTVGSDVLQNQDTVGKDVDRGQDLPNSRNRLFNQELLINRSCDEPLVGGKIPGWKEVKANWIAKSLDPNAYAGKSYFAANASAVAELTQDIDLREVGQRIDKGIIGIAFSGATRSWRNPTADTSEAIIEFRDESNSNVLANCSSGIHRSRWEWETFSLFEDIPKGTRVIRVRLVSERNSGNGNDGYFDDLSLRLSNETKKSHLDPIIGNWRAEVVNFRFSPDGTWTSNYSNFGGKWSRKNGVVEVVSNLQNKQVFTVESKDGARWVWNNGRTKGVATKVTNSR